MFGGQLGEPFATQFRSQPSVFLSSSRAELLACLLWAQHTGKAESYAEDPDAAPPLSSPLFSPSSSPSSSSSSSSPSPSGSPAPRPSSSRPKAAYSTPFPSVPLAPRRNFRHHGWWVLDSSASLSLQDSEVSITSFCHCTEPLASL